MQDDLNQAILPATRFLLLIQDLIALAQRTGVQDIYLLLAALLAALLAISILITLLVWLRIFVIAALVCILITAGVRWMGPSSAEAQRDQDESGSGDKTDSGGGDNNEPHEETKEEAIEHQ
ncbi:MAG: hypothetical protein M1835_001765 [Candelina submexicana]|nr:MAG: hypothetical protein M1835_001765 [Candelina submexicana]